MKWLTSARVDNLLIINGNQGLLILPPTLDQERRCNHRSPFHPYATATLHVEYAERGNQYGFLFIFSLFCEYIHLEYICIHGIYRVNQAEYAIHILVVAPQEYVNRG